MPKRKADKTWAEEIAELDDSTPRDLDPEQLDDDGISSEDGSEKGNGQAKEHYLDISSSKLRKPNAPTLGPEYSGSRISRDSAFDHEDSDIDPFANDHTEQDSSGEENEDNEYADPDNADVSTDKANDQDEEIDSFEAFGSDDSGKYKDYVFRGSKTLDDHALRKVQSKGSLSDPPIDDDGDGFSDMESEEDGPAVAADGVNGFGDDSFGTASESELDLEDSEDVEMEDHDGLSAEGEDSESEISDSENSTPPPVNDDRATLRKMMAESQKSITSNLSKAAKSDIARGRAIRKQRTAFDCLLNTRIRLQKALIAANSLPSPNASTTPPSNQDPAVEAAEKAALRLWSTLDSLRQSITPTPTPTPGAPTPQPPQPDTNTPLSTLWTRMQNQDTQYRPPALKTLNKWSQKTAPISSLPRANKFSQTAAQQQQPLSKVLEQQLSSSSNMEKLVAKTKVPRSCAPVQAAAALSSTKKQRDLEDENQQGGRPELPSYDDADFYSLLLRDLVDSRSSLPFPPTNLSTHTPTNHPTNHTHPSLPHIQGIKPPHLRTPKTRTDTKASKGRKMRYAVHEKLQNFMAPEERGTWGEGRRGELFGGLLGGGVRMGEGEGGVGDEGDGEEEGLRLF
ncbi:MAG: hypothetical protein LQ350_005988 [Teloschistes chrysophthalmus]|nr:MAG: hypothetical protein LQ350_005988 [Niorma chrysophthalma]